MPTLDMLWNSCQRELLDPRRFHDRLFTSVSGNFDTNNFSSILSSISGEPVVDFGMGCAMGLVDMHHYLISIMQKHCRGIPHRNLLEEYFNEQSGHGDDAAENYAITFASIINISDDHLGKFTELSKLQHHLIYPNASASSTREAGNYQGAAGSTLSSVTGCETIMYLACALQSLLASQMAPLASQLATALAPAIKRNIIDAFAAITPVNAQNTSPTNPVMQQRHASTMLVSHESVRPALSSPEAELGVTVVDILKVEVQPAHWWELHELMGPHAKFKSQHQACALELSVQRKSDLLVILPMGGGKSLLFMACTVNVAESNLAMVMIVPLVALLEDLKSHLKAKGIRVADWANDHPKVTGYSAHVIIVLADTAATPEFLSYFLKGCQEGKIARAIIDEIDSVLTAAHYWPIFNVIKCLREGHVSFLGLSVTIPPNSVGMIIQCMNFLPGNTLLIRAPTERKGIVYSVLILENQPRCSLADASYPTPTGELLKLMDYVDMMLHSFHPKE